MPQGRALARSGRTGPTCPTCLAGAPRNIRLLLEFDGAGFAGWQYQPGHRTVQGELQSALAKIVGRPTTVYGCSRTDAGVSARNYVANFHWDCHPISGRRKSVAVPGAGHNPNPPGIRDCVPSRPQLARLCRALNFHLPREILVKQAEEAPPGFHARHSARNKTYLYRILRGRSPLRSARVWEFYFPLDADRMRRALRHFAGRHDFRAFCHLRLPARDMTGKPGLSRIAASDAGDCPGFSTPPPAFCTLTRLGLTESDDEVLVTVRGDRFMYKMVRRIVGAAVTYGAGGITLADIRAALAGRKHQPFKTAPAEGLVLDKVEY